MDVRVGHADQLPSARAGILLRLIECFQHCYQSNIVLPIATTACLAAVMHKGAGELARQVNDDADACARAKLKSAYCYA